MELLNQEPIVLALFAVLMVAVFALLGWIRAQDKLANSVPVEAIRETLGPVMPFVNAILPMLRSGAVAGSNSLLEELQRKAASTANPYDDALVNMIRSIIREELANGPTPAQMDEATNKPVDVRTKDNPFRGAS